jgi:hypothetical protein
MSKRETPMTRWYWEQIGGTLVEEFPAVLPKGNPLRGRRLLDGLIVLGGERCIAAAHEVDIQGRDVVIVQAKAMRLGMYLMGQTLFSMALVRSFGPRSMESVALCAKDDEVLRPLLEAHAGCRVVVCPSAIVAKVGGQGRVVVVDEEV